MKVPLISNISGTFLDYLSNSVDKKV